MKHPILISLLFLATACGEDLMTYEVTTGMPVVEAYITEGENLLSLRLYSMEAYSKDEYTLSRPITGLQPEINGRPLNETSAGTYSLDLGNDTIRGMQSYNLSFDYLNRHVGASTTVPKPVQNLTIEPESISIPYYYRPTVDSVEIRLSWDDPDKSYYQIYIESPATTDMPMPGGGTLFMRRMMQPFRGNSYTAGSREFRTTGYYWIYVYRVNKEYVDLYERASSTDLANPGSSIENGFGIFTAMSVGKIGFQVIESSE
jgi:hypothetical protein